MKIKDIFKKDKTGKEVSEGGSEIIRHTEPTGDHNYESETFYIDDIEEYFNENFPNRTSEVFHEIVSDIVHIDVHIMMPTEEENFYVLYTTGMSTLAMNMPEELQADYKHLERAEFFLTIPGSVDIEEIKEGKYFWTVNLLRTLARYVHTYNTWFSHGHSIPNGANSAPYDEFTKFTGSMFIYKDAIAAKDDVGITFLEVFPLFTEEMNMKLDLGVDALMEKLIESNYCGVFNERENVGI